MICFFLLGNWSSTSERACVSGSSEGGPQTMGFSVMKKSVVGASDPTAEAAQLAASLLHLNNRRRTTVHTLVKVSSCHTLQFQCKKKNDLNPEPPSPEPEALAPKS